MPMALALQLCHCSFLGIFYNLCLSVPASAYGGRLRLALLACCLASLLSRELAVRLTAASALAATSEATANVKGVEEEVISRLLTLRNCISYSLKLHFQRFCKILEGRSSEEVNKKAREISKLVKMPLAPLKDPWQQVPIVDNESDEV